MKDKLKKLGLTNKEILTYEILLKNESLNAKEISFRTSTLPNTVYRTCKNLEVLGFVKILDTYPKTFCAIKEVNAISPLADKKIDELKELSKGNFGSILSNQSPTSINLIYGGENIFSLGSKLLNEAKNEMLVISIGEPIPPEMLLSVRNAVERRVKIKMIAHKNDSENHEVLENLKKNGYEIRHFPGWGFHIAVYDGEKAMIIVNNPENTDERAAMFITSVGLARALKDYFENTWQKAKRV